MDNKPVHITIEYEDGSMVEREVGGVFKAGGETYAFLTSKKTSVNGEVEFIRLDPITDADGEEDFIITPITTREEYDIVIAAFNDYINDILNEDDEECVTVDLMTDDGIVTCDLLNIFYLNNRNYAALYYEDKNIVDFVRAELVSADSPDMCRFTSITSELEFDRVQEYYRDTYMLDTDMDKEEQ